jgi:phosphatidylserine decarboxylase
MRDEASEHNERTAIIVETPDGSPVRFVLVAGLVARRIVCRVAAGRALDAGERVGIIRFGSRVDLDLPAGATLAVGVGDRVVAGETVVARRVLRPA